VSADRCVGSPRGSVSVSSTVRSTSAIGNGGRWAFYLVAQRATDAFAHEPFLRARGKASKPQR
jgi:hypothetical protein